MNLVDVYETHNAELILYRLLRDRDPKINISHTEMPTFDEHVDFIESRPYAAWYLVQNEGANIGSVYLTRDDEIGVFIFKRHHGHGYGPKAVEQLMEYHPRDRYYANIAPMNQISKKVFQRLGFRKHQETFIYYA